MYKILATSICLLLLFSFTNCSEDVQSISEQEVFIQKVKDIKELIDSIGTYPLKPTKGMQTELLSSESGPVIYRYDEEIGKSDYFIPTTIEQRRSAFETIADLPPMKSADVIWPGNLIQGESVMNGNLAAIPLADKRAGGNIVLNVVSGQENMRYYRTVTDMSGAGVVQAMNDILGPYNSGFPADVSYMQSAVSSEEEMAYHLDMRLEEFRAKSSGTFNSVNWTNSTNKIMVKLRQVFFTMSYDFQGVQNVFSTNIEYSDLTPYVSKDNPPCYISSVSYGRYFILLYESNYSEYKLSNVLRKAYGSENQEAITNEETKIMRNANVYLVQVGGNPESGLETITGDPEKIREFVGKGATFSKDNVGAPISYKVCYLSNAVPLTAYRSLDVTSKKLVYSLEEKKNNVTIEIKSLRSNRLRLSGGNREISNHSWLSVGNIEINVYNRNGSLYKRLNALNPGIHQVGTKNNDIYLGYSHVVSTGELGVNTDKRVVIEFPVTYHNVRYGGGTAEETKVYQKRIEYLFNDKTQRWEVGSKDMYQSNSFSSMSISDNFNFCDVFFNLGIRFNANHQNY